MRLLVVGGIVAILLGAGLGLALFATPECRNYRGTARDSGYPCRIERSSGATDFVLSRSRTLSVPYAGVLAVGLLVAGGIGVARGRR